MQAAAPDAGPSGGPPYVLKLGRGGRAAFARGPPPEPSVDAPLCLVAEWQPAAHQRYDAAAALHPHQHPSAVAVEQARRSGGRTLSLTECVEVRAAVLAGVGVPQAGRVLEGAARVQTRLLCLLQAFLQPERLAETDSWFCTKCKQHVQVRASLCRGWCAGCASVLLDGSLSSRLARPYRCASLFCAG